MPTKRIVYYYDRKSYAQLKFILIQQEYFRLSSGQGTQSTYYVICEILQGISEDTARESKS